MVKMVVNSFLIVCFLLYIYSFGVLFFASADKEKSYYENRLLAQAPEKNTESILSGEYSRKYEEYFTDQFIGRDYWIRAYKTAQFIGQENLFARFMPIKDSEIALPSEELTEQERLERVNYLKKVKLVDGFHITPDGWIMAEPVDYFPKEGMIDAATQMNDLGRRLNDKGIEFYFTLLPNKLEYVKLTLPEDRGEGRILQNKAYLLKRINSELVPVIDTGKYFRNTFDQNKINELYFKTDHHWNMTGAFAGYKFFINQLRDVSQYDIPEAKNEDYQFNCFKDKDFIGSWNKQLFELVKTKESICYYNPIGEDKQFDNYQVYNGAIKAENLIKSENVYAAGINKPEKIEYGDAYAGDYPELNIINERNENKPNILIIKDSYTNPIIFHIASHFYRTTFYDIRYNKGRTLNEFIEENDYDIVVVMYNDKTVSGEMFSF